MTPAAPGVALPLTVPQQAAWKSAQALWGVTLHDALAHPHAEKGTFAWFSFPPQVWFDLDDARARGVADHLESIFAHEIGHHVLSPSTRHDSLKLRHQMARALSASGAEAGSIRDDSAWFSNAWSDMLINVRVAEMQRRWATPGGGPAVEPQMIDMWRVLSQGEAPSRPWWVVMRAYEVLWSKPPGTLCPTSPVPAPAPFEPTSTAEKITPTARTTPDMIAKLEEARLARVALQSQLDRLSPTRPELDAQLLADTVRAFGADPVSGALRFGMIMAPYFVEQQRARHPERRLVVVCGGQLDDAPATPGELVAVLADARLTEPPEHPAVAGRSDAGRDGDPSGAGAENAGQGYGLAETVSLYGSSSETAVLSAWYQAKARPWVKPLVQPTARPVVSDEFIPGALEEWAVGDEFADIDWPATLSRGVTVVPGVTTRRREVLPDSPPPAHESVRLDLYIDSSGSMRSPGNESPAVLAGTILMLSALQGGGRVRVTSFSGQGQVAGQETFTRDRTEAFAFLASYFGGGTTFPLDLYASRYRATRRTADVRRHVVVLSDDGLHSLFGEGQPGLEGVAASVRQKLDTATLIVQDSRHSIGDEATAAGYDVFYVDRMDDAPAACAALAARLAEPRATSTAGAARRAFATGGRRG